MKILLVENSPSDAEILLTACQALDNVQIDLAESLESANTLIERSHAEYDLAIFDLQIPSTNQALDEHVDHGLAAFVRLGKLAPGTIRFVWTGKATNEAWEQIFVEQDKADPLGTNEQEVMVKFFTKEKFRACIACLTEIAESMDVLDGIRWSWGMEQQVIDPMTKRVINIFARRQRGVLVHAGALGDGLSGSSVLRLQVTDEQGAPTASVVGKVGDVQEVKDELSRYSQYVAPSLKIGAYAPLSDRVLVGADGLGGAFFKLVDPEAKSLFEIADADPALAAEVVERLAKKLAPWQGGAAQKRVLLSDVRKALLPDNTADALSHALSFDRQTAEATEVFVHESIIHGDLHGLNVLVDSDGEPIVIDYAEVRKAAAALDPITLELSALLHPKSPLRGLWENADLALWANAPEFFASCPQHDFFVALRKWAFDVAACDQEVYAAAYAYCLRQLKYDGVDAELAEQLASAAVSAMS
jgi:CheY-like chemotaxis protein